MSQTTVQKPPLVDKRAVPESPRNAFPRPRTYRPEVQGLRALAVLMVVAYHVWFDRISGGVDVFLLVSAFC